MTQHERASGNVIWSVWHRERQDARETTFSKEESGPHEQDAYDLDSADIDGLENPRHYKRRPKDSEWWKTTEQTTEYDIRDRPNR